MNFKQKKHSKSQMGWSSLTVLNAAASGEEEDAAAAKPAKRRSKAKSSKTSSTKRAKSTKTKSKAGKGKRAKRASSSKATSVVASSTSDAPPKEKEDEKEAIVVQTPEIVATDETKVTAVELEPPPAASTTSVSANNNNDDTNDILSDDELYKLLYEDQDIAAAEDIDYGELDRLRIQAENELYDKYQYYDNMEDLVDEEGVEIGWDPIFGSSNPIDGRAILSKIDSYMVSEETKDDRMLINQSPSDEQDFQNEINQIVSSRNKLEVYQDPYLKVDVPRHTKPWYGTVDMDDNPYEAKDWMNNRFTTPEAKTDVSKLTPYEARKYAVQLARSVNNEWLPDGYSQQRNHEEVKLFQERQILAGSLLKGPIDEDRLKDLQPILRKLGGVAHVLSISPEGIYRFHYFGLMKHRLGMQNWVELMLKEQGTSVQSVRFETGHRKVDPRDSVFKGFECYGRVLPNDDKDQSAAGTKLLSSSSSLEEQRLPSPVMQDGEDDEEDEMLDVTNMAEP